jgi:hypothetical protein
MADGYDYDVFLSAASESPVEEWVDNHFLGMLRTHLSNEMTKKPKVFWYKEQSTGVDWKANLKKELSRSRILLAVLSPHYFRSDWCMAEFESIIEREKQLKMGELERPEGLIYPVLFSDGDCFKDVGRVKYWKDLSKWRYHWPQFRDSDKYLEFDQAMRGVGSELAKQIKIVPPWRKDFPVIISPKTLSQVKMELPRI